MRKVWFAFVWISLFGFMNQGSAQNLVVLEETTGFEHFRYRDVSTRVGLRVQLNSAETLTHLFPILEPPACAQVNGQSLFATTYLGYEVDGNLVAATVPSLSQNQTVTLVFNIHLFAGSGNVCQTAVCSGNRYEFTLSYRHAGSATPIQAATRNLATFSGPLFGGFDIVERFGTTNRDFISCAEIRNTLEADFLFEGFDRNLLNDPASRVFLGVDYDAFLSEVNGEFIRAFSSYLLPIGNGRFFDFLDAVFNQGLQHTSGPIYDVANGRLFNTVPTLGGDGGVLGDRRADCDLQFWNFFDITQFSAQGSAPKAVISDWGDSTVFIDVSQVDVDHRETALFLGYANNCLAREGLGSSLADFEITGLAFKPDQLVEVTLDVPASWLESGNRLRSDYSLSFYYRDDTSIQEATIVTGTNRNTRITLFVPYTTPSEFQIEARIQRTAADGFPAIASVISPQHQLDYAALGDVSFQNAEMGVAGQSPDAYLDMGERLTKLVRIQNVGSNPLQAVTVELDVVSSGFSMLLNRSTTTGPFDGVFLANEVVDLQLFYELVFAEASCAPLVLNYRVAYANNGFTTSYESQFTVEANCQDVAKGIALDGTWTALECTGNPVCGDPNCTGSELICGNTNGWFFEAATGNWVGSTLNNNFFYQLVSPPFRPGDDAHLSLLHQAAFRRDFAGGVLEYRNCATSDDCERGLWQDLIRPIEFANNVSLYTADPLILDPSLDQVVRNRPVFAAMVRSQSIEESVPNSLLNRNYAQFRFVYQIVDDSGFPPPGSWTIEAFNYEYEEALADNVLGLPSPLLVPCDSVVLELEPEAPGSYIFEFYLTLDDLLAGDPPQESNRTGVWAYPIPEIMTTYYARVTNLTTGTRRVWPLTAVPMQEGPEFETCTTSWLSEAFGSDCDLNGDTAHNILDIVIQRNEDLCVE